MVKKKNKNLCYESDSVIMLRSFVPVQIQLKSTKPPSTVIPIRNFAQLNILCKIPQSEYKLERKTFCS